MEVKPISNNQLKYLSFQKVIPRDNYHDISVHKYYIYCYLDPFRSGEYHFKIMGKPFTFGYEPVYVGKASSAHGYRHNQHIAEFLKGFDSEEPSSPSGITMSYNITKYNTFTEIDKQMKVNTNPNLPSNWEEYQKNWIIILEHYDDANELIQAEKEFIRTIGVQYKHTGPLTNAILG